MGKTKIWTFLLCLIGLIFIIVGVQKSGFTANKLLTIGVSTIVSSSTTYLILTHHLKKSKIRVIK